MLLVTRSHTGTGEDNNLSDSSSAFDQKTIGVLTTPHVNHSDTPDDCWWKTAWTTRASHSVRLGLH